jgi:2-(1,2-epoxy-1,2-dihydrophenyl)acetyl-CoA isomerase
VTFVDYSLAGGVARIALVDADRGNPVHTDSVDELSLAVRRANSDGARVIVLSAQGRFFSVGGDLGAFATAENVGRYIDDLADSLHGAVSELVRSEAIVVAAVQGAAVGAGFPLAAAADVVIAARTATFSLGYTKVGLSVDGGSSLLGHSLGLHRALRLALLNDALTADEALAVGLVARVVEAAELNDATDALVHKLLNGPATAQAATKRLLRDAVEPKPEAAMRREALEIRRNASSGDGREGVAAFLEKREAVFLP